MLLRRMVDVVMPLGCCAAAAVACCAQSAAPAPAAPPQAETPYTIGVTVRSVVLDVVVTDANHHPVHGLTRKDFALLEDNRVQPISSFEEFNMAATPPFTAPKLPPMPPNTYLNVQTEDERGPLYVIVYDVVHMQTIDQTDARKQLAQFLAKKPAGTRYCLFLLGQELRLLQGFTTDPNLLLKAFDKGRGDGNYIPLVSLMGANLGADDPDMPYEVMSFVGRYLEGLPGRKVLIWMSSSFPKDVPLFGITRQIADAEMTGGGQGGGGAIGAPPVDTGGVYTGSGAGTFPGTSPASANQGFSGSDQVTGADAYSQKLLRDAIDSLNESDVAVYPVDVAGAKPELNGVDDLADHIALVTGGKAYYNSNDLVDAMSQASADGGSYYEISYAPTDAQYDQRLRKIRVELAKRGYHLDYRRYYFADPPDTPVTKEEKKLAAITDTQAAHKPGDTMYAYMQHGAPQDHEIIFRAQFQAGPKAAATQGQLDALGQQPAYSVPGKPSKVPKGLAVQTYTIDYLVPDRMVASLNGQMQLEFAATAYDADGKMVNGISQKANKEASDSAKPGGTPFFRADQTLDVPVTAAWLRVAVHDMATNRIGTLEIPLPLAAGTTAAPQTASTGTPPAANQ
ncbi:MAG TPA: VWA domain-containing protein [Acidobacteriaceae bacterium]|jgi:VWFA-related protein|nr:VWA domain-containing protein [Acidobacteriaceae bacterium]